MESQIPQQGTHHWVLTLDLPNSVRVTDFGTYTPLPNTTRHDAFTVIRESFIEQHPQLARASVLFFSLEPNDL
ncbi:hypothetical protein [Streptomyces sp. NPDC058664]|uniref:hypothetical protein n=1 Tax=unclassified Streptomyces TaxID=2593676 RepID=UPI003657EAC0